jgi:flagellar hook assembly protein FlgD
MIRLGDDIVNIPENSFNYSGLIHNYPNPFNSSTTISFSVEGSDKNTNINIYNFHGQIIKTLMDKKLKAGLHQAVWDGTNDSDNPVSSGIYFYKMKHGDKYTGFKKMILLR